MTIGDFLSALEHTARTSGRRSARGEMGQVVVWRVLESHMRGSRGGRLRMHDRVTWRFARGPHDRKRKVSRAALAAEMAEIWE